MAGTEARRGDCAFADAETGAAGADWAGAGPEIADRASMTAPATDERIPERPEAVREDGSCNGISRLDPSRSRPRLVALAS